MGVMKKKVSKVICLGAVLISLAGCGEEVAQPVAGTGQVEPVLEDNTITYQLLDEPELDYEVPEMKPGICVPFGGYDAEEEKQAYAYATVLPEEFFLLDEETGEEVYVGAFTEVKYHKDTGNYSAIADFSEVTEPGEYVLKCDYLGYSYPFSVEENLQENTLDSLVELYPETLKNNENLQITVDGALILLLSYELYGEVYQKENEGIPQVLSVISGIVEEIVEGLEAEDESPEHDRYMLAALMAKYGHTYKGYDWNRANDAIKLAKTFWKEAETARDSSSEYRLLAASELYRVTGTYSYRRELQDYFNGQIEVEEVLPNPYDCIGALTHFSTNSKVNRTLCTTLMEALLDQTEEIVSYVSLDNQLLSSNTREEKLNEIMWNMVLVSVVEYVITNYEYGGLIEDQYFFLQGRNTDAYDYLNEMIVENPRWMAAYMLMISEHLAHDHLE